MADERKKLRFWEDDHPEENGDDSVGVDLSIPVVGTPRPKNARSDAELEVEEKTAKQRLAEHERQIAAEQQHELEPKRRLEFFEKLHPNHGHNRGFDHDR